MKGKKQVAEPADFREGQHVEVARDAKAFKDSWFSAKILKLPNANSKKQKIVVQYKKLLAKENGEDPLKESVDPSAVRPIPPPQPPNQSFQLHQSVDALYNHGWWKGQVFQVLDNSRYIVHFPSWKEFTESRAAKLRVHLDWVDGKWVTPQYKKEDQRKKDIAHTSLKRRNQTNQLLGGSNSKLQKRIGESSSSPIAAPKGAIATRTSSSSIKAKEETHGRELANVVQLEFPLEGAELQIFSNTGNAPYLILCPPVNPQSMEIKQQEGGAETARQSETTLLESTEEFMNVTPSREVALRTECPPKGSELVTLSECEDVPPLCTWPTDSFSHAAAGDLLYNQVAPESNLEITWAETSRNDEVISEDGNLPFVKSLPVWQTFETSEIFRSTPQSPHFRPLLEYHERLREGQAAGYMLSHANLVENTSKAQVEESDSSILEKLEALEELDVTAFDVRAIRDRLEKLQGIKCAIVRLTAEMEQVESKIIKEKLEVEPLDSVAEEAGEKIRNIQKLIMEMEKTRQILMEKKRVKESNIFNFRENILKGEERKHQLNLGFIHVAAAPW